jgi:hypothetical protein
MFWPCRILFEEIVNLDFRGLGVDGTKLYKWPFRRDFKNNSSFDGN